MRSPAKPLRTAPQFQDEGTLQVTDYESAKAMRSSRKLKDYPPVPATPPPGEKKDRGLSHLEEELEQEKKYLAALCMENKELEEIIENFDKEIARLRSNFPQQIVGDGKVHASNEFWFKYESLVEVNRKLEREKKHLLNDIRQIEEQGMVNLDSLTQSELIMYVKQLERTKTDLLSDLRAKEWGLDKQAKDIHHLNEMKKALQAEIRHYDKEFALFRHYKKNSCPSASPTGSRHSSVSGEKRQKTLKQKEGSRGDKQSDVAPDRRSSLSQENVAAEPKNDIMFSSLDDSKFEGLECGSPDAGFAKKSLKGKKKAVKKGVAMAPLPPMARAAKKRPKADTKVGSESAEGSKPIKIVVTYETQSTTVGGEGGGEGGGEEGGEEGARAVSPGSQEETYEEDFEDSDVEKYREQKVGFLTTRV